MRRGTACRSRRRRLSRGAATDGSAVLRPRVAARAYGTPGASRRPTASLSRGHVVADRKLRFLEQLRCDRELRSLESHRPARRLRRFEHLRCDRASGALRRPGSPIPPCKFGKLGHGSGDDGSFTGFCEHFAAGYTRGNFVKECCLALLMNIAFIPARGGSKGLPDKNLIPLAGRSLVERSVATAQKSAIFDKVFVSTDSEKIAEQARALGAAVPFLRPSDLASDTASSVDVVIDAIRSQAWSSEDKICLLQPTSPMRTSDHLRRSFELFEEHGESVIATQEFKLDPALLRPLGDGPQVFLEDNQFKTRRQDSAACVFPNGCIYLNSVATILKHRALIPPSFTAMVMSHWESIDIDDKNDFRAAEALIKAGFQSE